MVEVAGSAMLHVYTRSPFQAHPRKEMTYTVHSISKIKELYHGIWRVQALDFSTGAGLTLAYSGKFERDKDTYGLKSRLVQDIQGRREREPKHIRTPRVGCTDCCASSDSDVNVD